MNFRRLVQSKKIIIMLGAGGVGKTSGSVAVALLAAQQGQRVGLLSIDPAKRLADALGITLGAELHRVELGPEFSGTLSAAMLDQKAVFDQMVSRSAPNAKVADAIMRHPFYKAAAANLGGAIEYMALAKLQQMEESGLYDCIVLDTPPDTHALDFLNRPNILSGFIENKVVNWLLRPFLMAQKAGLGRVFNAGERLMGGVASITGIAALKMMAEFMVLMQEVIDGFHTSGERVTRLVRLPTTAFILISSPRTAPMRSAKNMLTQLKAMGLNCDRLVFNRCRTVPNWNEVSALNLDLIEETPVRLAVEALINAQRASERIKVELKDHAASRFGARVGTMEIPELTKNIHSLEGMMDLVACFDQ